MSAKDFKNEEELRRIGALAVARARKWVDDSKKYPNDYAGKLLSGLLADKDGLDFTVAFVDEVVRPEDLRVAARSMARLGRRAPGFLPLWLKFGAKLGGALAPVMPPVVVPLARRIFATLVGDLVMDISEAKLGKAIAKLRDTGARLNMNLLGEAVLGDKEAQKRLDDTMGLLRREDVDYVSMKVSAVTGPHNPWDFDEIADYAVKQLLPLYHEAAASSTPKFINLDMEEYKDLHLTIRVFKEILDREELKNLQAGIVLQCYLPDSLAAMEDLQAWAAKRVAEGGAPIKVRVVKGANISMERVDATMHGWEMTTQPSKQATDASYIRMLDYALRPEHTKNVRIGVAGMNIFTIAFAYELASARGVLAAKGCEFEMLTGMAATLAHAVSDEVGGLLYYVPVVHPEEYDVAIAYLIRRLEEIAAPENFMSAAYDLATNESLLERERGRFEAALGDAYTQPYVPRRVQNRLTETQSDIESFVKNSSGKWEFNNTPDTDPALPANLEWAKGIVARVPSSSLGVQTLQASYVADSQALAKVIETAKTGSKLWSATSASERSEILHKVGLVLSQRRAELIEVAASEAGKALDQGDVEVSEAVDYAHYYAHSALELEGIAGAKFTPAGVTVITPPWNFPMAIPAGSTLAALAAGSAVILKPASLSARCGAVLAECLWEAGVPKEALQLIKLANHDLGKELICNKVVERLVLTGSAETAERFRNWRPDLGLLAETSGKNSIIVTPAADLDLAVKDVVGSAFGHAGQKCSAASLVILVGSVGRSKRFHTQLIDAVKSLQIGYPDDLGIQMGPLVEPAKGKLLRGLTELEPGQHWAIKPKQLDESGKLWSPGVRANVQPGSEYHLVEYFGPILGVIRCETLEEAVKIQNQVEFGLTGGIHSLDADEISYWLDNVQVGNAYINRGITGAIVRRQPFGGWKRSVVGATTKAGGPSYLYGLGKWRMDTNSALRLLDGAAPTTRLGCAIMDAGADAALPAAQKDLLRIAVASDEAAMRDFFTPMHDPSQLGVERNVLRFCPTPVLVRFGAQSQLWELLRVVGAGLAAGAQVSVSTATEPGAAVRDFLELQGVELRVQSEESWLERGAKAWAASCGYDGRIRLVGEETAKLSAAIHGSIDVAIWDDEVTTAGRVEIVPFLREQAIALTNHRFGDPTPVTRNILAGDVRS